MSKNKIQEKILNLENDLNEIKKAIQSKPDFSIDKKNWKKSKKKVKDVRKELYKEQYE